MIPAGSPWGESRIRSLGGDIPPEAFDFLLGIFEQKSVAEQINALSEETRYRGLVHQQDQVKNAVAMDAHGIISKGGHPKDEDEGHWITIHHHGETTHVFVDPSGRITKGPMHLHGASIHHIPMHFSVKHHSAPPKGHNSHPHYGEHLSGKLRRHAATRMPSALAHVAAQSMAARRVGGMRLSTNHRHMRMHAIRQGQGPDMAHAHAHVENHVKDETPAGLMHRASEELAAAAANGTVSALAAEHLRQAMQIHGPQYVLDQLSGEVAADSRHHIMSMQGHTKPAKIPSTQGHAVSGGRGQNIRVEDPAEVVAEIAQAGRPDEGKIRPIK